MPKIFFKTTPSSPTLFFTLSILLLLAAENGWAASASTAIQEGISDYQQKDYAKAESSFSKAAQELPDSPDLNYNLGNSQYKTGKFKQALQTYTKAMNAESSPELKGKALYNTGNTLFRLGKLEEAATAYKKVLEADPDDMDAKFNLEFVREQIKKKNEEKQKKNQPQGPNSKDNQDQNPKDSPGDKEDNKGNPPDSQNQESSAPQEPKQNGKPEPAEQQETAQDNAISKDQAEQWLSALDEDLKKFRKKQAGRENSGRPNQNKDW